MRSPVVARDEHRHADVGEAQEQPHDLFGELRIEVARGLVRDEQRRPRDDGARDADALLLARATARSAQRRLLAEQPHLVERGAHLAPDLAVAGAVDDERQRDVVEHAAIVQQLVVLEHDADAAAEGGNAPRRQA